MLWAMLFSSDLPMFFSSVFESIGLPVYIHIFINFFDNNENIKCIIIIIYYYYLFLSHICFGHV